jgi:hypothetical protein
VLYLKALAAGVVGALAAPVAVLCAHVALTTWRTYALAGTESSFDVSGALVLRPSLLGFAIGFSWMLRRGRKRVSAQV